MNPYGPRVWRYVYELSTDPELRRTILEWRPPSPTNATGIFFFVSVVAVAALLYRRRSDVRWPRLVALGLFFVVGATAVRGIIWWALAAPVLVADLIPAGAPRRDEPRALNTGIAVALAVLGIALLPWFRPTFASTANSVSATDGLLASSPNQYSSIVLREIEPGTRMFVPEIWASWFELEVPANPVMIDPRIELFTGAVWDDFDQISNGEGDWEAVVDRYGIDVLVLSREQHSGLIAVLGDHPGWDLVYEDADGLLLVRSAVRVP